MSKVRTIQNLVKGHKKRVYLYLADKETAKKFVADATAEGYTFPDGVKISERKANDFYVLNPDKTVNFINSIGRVAFQCNAQQIIRVDYQKYINGEENYYV